MDLFGALGAAPRLGAWSAAAAPMPDAQAGAAPSVNDHSTRDRWLSLLAGGPRALISQIGMQDYAKAQAQGRHAALDPLAQMYQGGQPPSSQDPGLQAAAARALTSGYVKPEDVNALTALAKANDPNIQSNGQWTYNANDKANANKFWGKPPVDGAMPLVDPNTPNAVKGWYLPDGTVQAVAATEGARTTAQQAAQARFAGPIAENTAAGTLKGQIPYIGQKAFNEASGEARAKAPYSFLNVQGPDGAPRLITQATAAELGANGGVIARGQAPDDQLYKGKLAGASADRYASVQASAPKAQAMLDNLGRIENLIGTLDGGKFTPAGLEIASAANSLGFKMDKKMSNAQAAQALTSQMALQLRDPANGGGMPGAMSDADRRFLSSMTPGLAQSAEGRRQIIATSRAVAQRQIDMANKMRAWNQKFGRIDQADVHGKSFDDYMQAWVKTHPLMPH